MSLLQSAVPPALAPNEIQSILAPAWSLSPEWQFYLIAPVLVWMLRRRVWAFGLVAATLVMMKVFAHPALDDWIAWASLPKYLHLFVIGILTRLALPHLRIPGGRAWITALAPWIWPPVPRKVLRARQACPSLPYPAAIFAIDPCLRFSGLPGVIP